MTRYKKALVIIIVTIVLLPIIYLWKAEVTQDESYTIAISFITNNDKIINIFGKTPRIKLESWKSSKSMTNDKKSKSFNLSIANEGKHGRIFIKLVNKGENWNIVKCELLFHGNMYLLSETEDY